MNPQVISKWQLDHSLQAMAIMISTSADTKSASDHICHHMYCQHLCPAQTHLPMVFSACNWVTEPIKLWFHWYSWLSLKYTCLPVLFTVAEVNFLAWCFHPKHCSITGMIINQSLVFNTQNQCMMWVSILEIHCIWCYQEENGMWCGLCSKQFTM